MHARARFARFQGHACEDPLRSLQKTNSHILNHMPLIPYLHSNILPKSLLNPALSSPTNPKSYPIPHRSQHPPSPTQHPFQKKQHPKISIKNNQLMVKSYTMKQSSCILSCVCERCFYALTRSIYTYCSWLVGWLVFRIFLKKFATLRRGYRRVPKFCMGS